MPETRNMAWFRRAALAATLLCAIVVVVGAWVRLTNAGLGCPDWPGCYGHAHPAQAAERAAEINAANPDRPFDYRKAINEMVHRYIVGGLGILVIGLALLSVWNRRDPAQPRVLPWALVVLLVAQALLGMWTVTLLLKPLIVTLHLLGGLLTLALLWWLALPPARRELKAAERGLRRLVIAGIAVLAVQVALGGWTSTNYAAAACPDFPTCQASYWPPMDFRNAFILWRGLGIDYRRRRARRACARRDPLHASARGLRHGGRAAAGDRRRLEARPVARNPRRRGRGRDRAPASSRDRDEPDLEGLATLARHGPQCRRSSARARDGRAAPKPEPALGSRPLPAVAAIVETS